MQTEKINRSLVKFIWAALIFFAWTLIQGAVITQEPIRLFVETGPGKMISVAKTHVGLTGWVSLALMAVIYYIEPIISGKSIVWPKLIEWIFWIWVVCTTVGIVLLMIAGVRGGSAFATGVKGAALGGIIRPYAMPAGLLCTISVIASLMFVVQILVTLAQRAK